MRLPAADSNSRGDPPAVRVPELPDGPLVASAADRSSSRPPRIARLTPGNWPSASASPAAPPAPRGCSRLTEVRADDLGVALDAQKGKVVLADFWATWCGPCVKKFPHFVETGKKYKGKGLICVGVNMDKQRPAKGYDKTAVLDFLKAKEAAFPNYLLLDHEAGAAKIERRFGLTGGVPFMALFGRDGGRVWDSEAEPLGDDQLDKRIEAELAK